VDTPATLIPVNDTGKSVLGTGCVVHVTPCGRNVFVTQSPTHAADIQEYRWLLMLGGSNFWYDKPCTTYLKQWEALENTGCKPEELVPIGDARPVSLQTPRVWASPALTTSLDDCKAGHQIEKSYRGTYHQCSEGKTGAVERTPLVYCLILTTSQASTPFMHEDHFNGRQIYMMIRCGSRESAVNEAFYAAGVNGWNVAFSCVMRFDENHEGRTGIIRKVEELGMLAKEEENGPTIRLFY
jgi:hypothetical protein